MSNAPSVDAAERDEIAVLVRAARAAHDYGATHAILRIAPRLFRVGCTACGMASSYINPLSLVEYGTMRFLIADAPSDHNLPMYIKARGTRAPARPCAWWRVLTSPQRARMSARAIAHAQEFQKYGVTDVVRLSHPTYNADRIRDAHIRMHVRAAQPI